jgi:excisionase family DNA binding protein
MDTPTDLICVNEACKLVPSPRGKRTHLSTVYRMIFSGRLRAWKNGRWYFVSRQEILDLLKPVPADLAGRRQRKPPTRAEVDEAERRRRVKEELRRMGV